MDVVPYIKKRSVDQIIVPLNDEIRNLKEAMFAVRYSKKKKVFP